MPRRGRRRMGSREVTLKMQTINKCKKSTGQKCDTTRDRHGTTAKDKILRLCGKRHFEILNSKQFERKGGAMTNHQKQIASNSQDQIGDRNLLILAKIEQRHVVTTQLPDVHFALLDKQSSLSAAPLLEMQLGVQTFTRWLGRIKDHVVILTSLHDKPINQIFWILKQDNHMSQIGVRQVQRN